MPGAFQNKTAVRRAKLDQHFIIWQKSTLAHNAGPCLSNRLPISESKYFEVQFNFVVT